MASDRQDMHRVIAIFSPLVCVTVRRYAVALVRSFFAPFTVAISFCVTLGPKSPVPADGLGCSVDVFAGPTDPALVARYTNFSGLHLWSGRGCIQGESYKKE